MIQIHWNELFSVGEDMKTIVLHKTNFSLEFLDEETLEWYYF